MSYVVRPNSPNLFQQRNSRKTKYAFARDFPTVPESESRLITNVLLLSLGNGAVAESITLPLDLARGWDHESRGLVHRALLPQMMPPVQQRLYNSARGMGYSWNWKWMGDER